MPTGGGVVEGIEVQADGPVRIAVRDVERGLEAQSGPAQAVGERGHYFGGIHFHTRLSVDGDRDPRAAYAYARDFLNLDVVRDDGPRADWPRMGRVLGGQ